MWGPPSPHIPPVFWHEFFIPPVKAYLLLSATTGLIYITLQLLWSLAILQQQGRKTHTQPLSRTHTQTHTHTIRPLKSDNKSMPCGLIEFSHTILTTLLWGACCYNCNDKNCTWIGSLQQNILLYTICSCSPRCLSLCYFAFCKTFVWVLISNPRILCVKCQASHRSRLRFWGCLESDATLSLLLDFSSVIWFHMYCIPFIWLL